MYGLILTLERLSDWTWPVELEQLTSKLLQKCLPFSINPLSHPTHTWQITIKYWQEADITFLTTLPHSTYERCQVCNVVDCYHPLTAPADLLVYDHRGEQPLEELHQCCLLHCRPSTRMVAATGRMIEIEAGSYWTRLVLFRLRPHQWYGQRLQRREEYGEFGTPLGPYVKATRWIGPSPTRDAAESACCAQLRAGFHGQ